MIYGFILVVVLILVLAYAGISLAVERFEKHEQRIRALEKRVRVLEEFHEQTAGKIERLGG